MLRLRLRAEGQNCAPTHSHARRLAPVLSAVARVACALCSSSSGLTHKALGPRSPLTKQRHTTWAGARMLADDATVKRH